jgi:hypothetical protein
VEGELGTLETGKRATIILTTGDPLEITTRTRHAFIDGREIDLSNKQTALNEKYRERYRQMGELTPASPAGAPDSERANTPGAPNSTPNGVAPGAPGTPAATRPNQGTPTQNPAQRPPATAPAQRER